MVGFNSVSYQSQQAASPGRPGLPQLGAGARRRGVSVKRKVPVRKRPAARTRSISAPPPKRAAPTPAPSVSSNSIMARRRKPGVRRGFSTRRKSTAGRRSAFGRRRTPARRRTTPGRRRTQASRSSGRRQSQASSSSRRSRWGSSLRNAFGNARQYAASSGVDAVSNALSGRPFGSSGGVGSSLTDRVGRMESWFARQRASQKARGQRKKINLRNVYGYGYSYGRGKKRRKKKGRKRRKTKGKKKGKRGKKRSTKKKRRMFNVFTT